MKVMQSMEYTDDEQLEASMPIPMPDRPKYPYGLRICLTEKELAKLGLDPGEAEVGGIVHFEATAAITSVSCNEMEGGEKCCRVELQIQDMAMDTEEEDEDEPAEDRRAARMSRMYDRDKD